MLHLVSLSVRYPDRPVLHDVSFNVQAGEIVALVGPNGAGKSSLIRAISGVIPIAAGTITLEGHNLATLRARERARRIAVVPQAVSLPEAFTVAEIVMMGRTPHLPLWGGESEEDCRVAWAAMCQTQVEPFAERRINELSGGERQRVVVARALTQEPQVLLLDEATAHLDLKYQVGILSLVREVARERGLAVLATLHDLNQAAHYCDRVALLAEGRLAALGRPEEVFTAPILSKAYGVEIMVIPHPTYGTPLVLPHPF